MPTATPGPSLPPPTPGSTFGELLRQLRRRAGLTQGQLAALVGFSIAQISLLEKDRRRPDLSVVEQRFVPALGLDHEPHLRRRLLELATARRTRPQEGVEVHVRRTVAVETVVTEQWLEGDAPLPPVPTPLLGRRRELDQAIARLTHSSGRLLTLLGPPGVGKTHLALAIAAALQPFFGGGVCHVPLANVADPAALAEALAAALSLRDRGRGTPWQRLADHLRHQELLLVLDDFEHLLVAPSHPSPTMAPDPAPDPAPDLSLPVPAPTGVSPVDSFPATSSPDTYPPPATSPAVGLLVYLLAACPRLHLLVTSRAPLRLRAEQRLKVPPLAPAAAVELFLQRAAAVDADFTPDAAGLSIIAEICLRLDCLPLAIELVAARIDLLTPGAMLARLTDNRLDLLSAGPKDLPPHQRTLRRAIERSYTLLDAAERQLFRRCGIFGGSFDLPAAEACLALPDAADHLQSLLAKSLVKAAPMPDAAPPPKAGTAAAPAPLAAPLLAAPAGHGERRFILLETLRAYALEQLHASGEAPAQAARHARHYAALAADLGPRAEAAAPRAALAHDAPNLTAALYWLVAHDLPAACAMVAALRRFWYAAGRYDEGRRWAETVLAPRVTVSSAPAPGSSSAASPPPASPPPASALPSPLRAGVLLTLGQMQLNQGDTAAARTCLAEALAIFRAAGDGAVVAHTLIELGWAVYLAHDQQGSLPLFRECLDLAQGLGDDSLTAHALTSLTHVLVYEGACTPELLAAIEQGIALYRRLADGPGLAQALLTLATFHTQTGALAAALAAAEAAEATLTAGDQAGTRAWTHAMVAELLLLAAPDPILPAPAGSAPAPSPAADPAVTAGPTPAADPAPSPPAPADPAANLAANLAADLAAAEARLQAALAHFTAAHQRDGILIVRHHLGDLALKRGRLPEAAALFTASHAAALAGGDQRMTARCLMGLGRVALAAGDLPTARRHLAAGRALLAALPAFLPPAVQAAYAAAWAAVTCAAVTCATDTP